MKEKMFGRLSKGVKTDNIPVHIGTFHKVGAFFWTKEEKCIGFSGDAVHGHCNNVSDMDFGGCVDIGDHVEILGVEGSDAVVKVLKEYVPYGAQCPHGMIFLLPTSQILSWPELNDINSEKEKWRKSMSDKYVNGFGG